VPTTFTTVARLLFFHVGAKNGFSKKLSSSAHLIFVCAPWLKVGTYSEKLFFTFLVDAVPGADVMITIFCDFRQFSAKKIGVFLKNQCYCQIFA
jgi:hypothetical protein